MAPEAPHAVNVHLRSKDGRTSGARDSIRVENRDPRSFLDISLRRTIRVPDNGSSYGLPPDCGTFPIYSVAEFRSTLPAEMSAKGGCFIPVYQHEAMWINFHASQPFAIKVLAGGINAISGEGAFKDIATVFRLKEKLSQKKSIQDYVVAPNQKWLDGIAKLDGQVMQFVAAPEGSGYSIEAQVTGHDSVGGLQFEVIPAKYIEPLYLTILLRGHHDDSETYFKIKYSTPLRKVFDAYCTKQGIHQSYFRFIYRSSRIEPQHTPSSCGMEDGDIIEVLTEQVGGGPNPNNTSAQKASAEKPTKSPKAMVVAAGGLIKQTIVQDDIPAEDWDVDNTVFFNVQLINASAFPGVTGISAPPTPISAATYAAHGYPFYEMYEEPSGIKGDFTGLKSVGELDKQRGANTTVHGAEKDLSFRTVSIGDMKPSFIPVSRMIRQVAGLNIASDL